MIIDCISDMHGDLPECLKGGDLLIVAGDLTASDSALEYGYFAAWLDRQKYTKKVFIAGNHDNFLQQQGFEKIKSIYNDLGVDYLQDSGTEFQGLKIWGSPWTKSFYGINPLCKAFTLESDIDLDAKWKFIPEDTDILITHSPPRCFDYVSRKDESAGSQSLHNRLMHISPRLHVFGHIHENGGCKVSLNFGKRDCILVNASYLDKFHEPVNEPVRVIL